jgi:hypothetical protein
MGKIRIEPILRCMSTSPIRLQICSLPDLVGLLQLRQVITSDSRLNIVKSIEVFSSDGVDAEADQRELHSTRVGSVPRELSIYTTTPSREREPRVYIRT